jgi:hypothetical protein
LNDQHIGHALPPPDKPFQAARSSVSAARRHTRERLDIAKRKAEDLASELQRIESELADDRASPNEKWRARAEVAETGDHFRSSKATSSSLKSCRSGCPCRARHSAAPALRVLQPALALRLARTTPERPGGRALRSQFAAPTAVNSDARAASPNCVGVVGEAPRRRRRPQHCAASRAGSMCRS